MKQNQFLQATYFVGGVITIIGSLTELFEVSYAPYVFSFGVLLLVGFHFYTAWLNKDAENRSQRLTRSAFMASLLLVLAAYFMFTGSTIWVVAVLIYALSSFFLSFRGE